MITRLSSWRAEAALTTWAYRIAVKYLLNQRRHSALERRHLTFDSLSAELVDGLAEYQGADGKILAEEVRLRCTQAMLQCLDRAERLVYVLGEVFELPSDEAAWILDTTAAAYGKRLERARQRIRGFLRGHCGLVNPGAACRCSRRITAATAQGRLDPRNLGLSRHPASVRCPKPRGRCISCTMRRACCAAIRTTPRRGRGPRPVLSLVRSGRFPLIESPSPD